MDSLEDIFSIFIYRLFESTNSKEVVQTLLDNGFDQWEQTSELTEEILAQIGLSGQDAETILNLIKEMKTVNFPQT